MDTHKWFCPRCNTVVDAKAHYFSRGQVLMRCPEWAYLFIEDE